MNIAIIGCGKQAPKHISGLINRDEVDCIVVADLFSEQAQKLAESYDEKVVTSSIDDVFDDAKIDGVIISTPTPSHFDLCCRAIESGKAFLVEKPLSATLAEARTLLELSIKKNVPGMVGYIYRFSPIYEAFNTILKEQNQVIGLPAHVFFRISGRGSHQEWKHKKEKNGGAISEMMVHMIDLAVWYFGNAANIRLLDVALVRRERIITGETVNCDAEDWVVAHLTMQGGVRVLIQADMTSPVFKQFAEINGSNGILEGSIQPHYADAITLFEPCGEYTNGYQLLETPKANNYVNQSQCFLDMVCTGNNPNRCSLEDAVEVMRIQDELKSSLSV